MFAYFILIVTPLIYSIYLGVANKYERKKKGVIALFFSIMLVLLLLRDESVGIDLANYKDIFSNIGNYKVEHGYDLLNRFVRFIGGDFRLLLIFVAIISLIPVGVLYFKESGTPWVAISLFLYFVFSMYFSGLRQVLAMAFVVPAFYCTKHKKPIRFLICVLLAYIFHKSSLIILLLYPIYNIRFSKIWMLIIIPAIVLLFVFNGPVFSQLIIWFGGAYVEKYGSGTGATGAYGSLILLIIFLILSFVLPKEDQVDRETFGLRNILFLCVVLQCFAPIHPLAMRLNYYFLLLVPVLMSRVFTLGKSRYVEVSQLITIFLPAFFVSYFIINGYIGEDILCIFPYIPLWV